MRGLKLLGEEFATIIKSKKILIPIIAVLFIPVLYAGMFLGAFWDPYERLDDLPVAVVNLDEGALYNGKSIEAGKELVDKLKDKKGFKWEFVSEKTAKQGMDDRKYYMTVRIPSNFSKNTTTLLDANPKKSNLEYIPNESLNFLSSQIGGSAIEKIKSEVSATVTKTYAETMFNSLKDVSKGFADASDGAGQLHDGSGKITNGLGELSGKANDGLNQLSDGSQKITNGLGELNSKVSAMPGGVNQLLGGSQKITAGLGELNSKVSVMPGGVNQLLGGSQQITNGLGELNSKVSGMPGGVNQLLGGSQQITGGLNELINPEGKLQPNLGRLLGGSQQITGGLNELINPEGKLQPNLGRLLGGSQQITGGLNELINPEGKLQPNLGRLLGGSQQITNGLTDAQKGAQRVSSGASELSQGVSEWKKKAEGLSGFANKTAGDAKTVTANLGDLNEKIKALPEEYRKQLEPAIQEAMANSQKVSQETTGVAQGVQGLAGEEGAGKIEAGAMDLANGADRLDKEGISPLAEGSRRITGGLGQLVDSKGEFQTGLNKLAKGSEEITGGLGQLVDSKGEFQTGLNKLARGSGEITGGLGQLVDSKGEFQTGLNKLAKGSGEITGGLNTLAGSAGPLANGVSALYDGSGKITGGLNTLAGSAGPLANGVSALYDGSGKITGGLNTLAGSAGPLANGVSALYDGSGKITGGLGQFVDPKGDFQNGLTSLKDGSGKITDGSKELTTKLGEGAEKTSETKGDEKKYDMFASPVNVKTEKMAEVPNYGTGFTPYFLSLGLFVGALLLSIVFPLRETVGIPKSGFSWFISKFGVLFAVGVIQALVADAVLLSSWLGVHVQSVPYFILFSIITSLSFIALVQFLVTTFGDAGRFIAILTLILQLTTSAGTFPLELIPEWLQVCNAWFPMTYSVSGLKAVVSSGDFGFMWQNAGILMIFIVLLSLGTIGTLTWMHKRQYGKFTETE